MGQIVVVQVEKDSQPNVGVQVIEWRSTREERESIEKLDFSEKE